MTSKSNAQTEIAEFLKQAILEITPKMPDVAVAELAGKSIVDDLKLDSLDFINLLFRIEEQFGVKIPEPAIDEHDLYVFGNLADFVQNASRD